MSQKNINSLNTIEEHQILHQLIYFANRNNLELFNVRGSLYDRVKTIANNGGACPCYKERPHCPCKEVIQECRTNGECGCRLFVSKK